MIKLREIKKSGIERRILRQQNGCLRRKVLPIAALSLSCASSIPRRHDSFPVNLTVRREYVKGTPLEKKTYTDLWHISSGFLMTGCTVDNVPLSQSLLNREIVEEADREPEKEEVSVEGRAATPAFWAMWST